MCGRSDGCPSVYTYELATAQRTKVTVSYTAHTDGRVNLHVEYPGEQGDLPTIPAFGIEWTLPVQYTNLRFFGTGPEETYLDRKHAKLGVWSTNAFADHAPYLMPQETGNHRHRRAVLLHRLAADAGSGV